VACIKMADFCNKHPVLAHKLGISVCRVFCISKTLLTFKVGSEWVLKTLTQYWKRHLFESLNKNKDHFKQQRHSLFHSTDLWWIMHGFIMRIQQPNRTLCSGRKEKIHHYKKFMSGILFQKLLSLCFEAVKVYCILSSCHTLLQTLIMLTWS
jgi:hypothetical protein